VIGSFRAETRISSRSELIIDLSASSQHEANDCKSRTSSQSWRVKARLNSQSKTLRITRGRQMIIPPPFFRALKVAATIIILLLVWEICCRLFKVPNYLIPAPSEIAARFNEKRGLF